MPRVSSIKRDQESCRESEQETKRKEEKKGEEAWKGPVEGQYYLRDDPVLWLFGTFDWQKVGDHADPVAYAAVIYLARLLNEAIASFFLSVPRISTNTPASRKIVTYVFGVKVGLASFTSFFALPPIDFFDRCPLRPAHIHRRQTRSQPLFLSSSSPAAPFPSLIHLLQVLRCTVFSLDLETSSLIELEVSRRFPRRRLREMNRRKNA